MEAPDQLSGKPITVNGKEYFVQKLLGKGKGGYSYLAWDGDRKVVLKQIHHESCSYYTFGNKIEAELNDYKRLLQIGIPMPRMIDADLAQERIVKDYIDGPTVYEMVLHDQLPANCIDQVKAMCARLYPAGTNIDYFPTNFVLQEGILYYIDYECNPYMDQWNFENWGIQYWSKTPALMEYAQAHND